MRFFITNLADNKLKCFKDVYFTGDFVQERDSQLIVSKSSNFVSGQFDEQLAGFQFESKEINDYDYTFILAKYNPDDKVFRIQSDLIGFEEAFIYDQDGIFVFTDSPLSLIEFLNDHNKQTKIDVNKLKDLLYWGTNFIGDTILEFVVRVKPASFYEIHLQNMITNRKEYTSFLADKNITDPIKAASDLYEIIDSRFAKYQDSGLRFGIGLSGGLDSRAAAYFASKYKFNISPYFIGEEKVTPFLKTYDVKRSEEIAEQLGLGKVRVLHPSAIGWKEKIENDLRNSPLSISNALQNIGYDFSDMDVLLTGAMGGELFGACINDKVPGMTNEGLAKYLLSYIRIVPRYKRGTLIEKYKKQYISSDVYEELINKEEMSHRFEKMKNWVDEQKQIGLSNIKIVMKDLYYRFAKNHRTGYFYGLNGLMNVLPVYLTPSVIRQMLCWDDSLFVGKPVQKQFIKLLGDLSKIRSQTVEVSIESQFRKSSSLRKMFSIGERVLRGGGMNYLRWLRYEDFESTERDILNSSSIPDVINLKNEAWKNNAPFVRMTLVKTAMLQQKYKVTIDG
ncbi:hypothetical protein [Paenibacillus thermotolerans]|uniref:hypothetical protein n=1 Tax=Paenibacillus thermotolerans TaxID=3027807 RepID=UPI0023678928|nr:MULTISPECIES: hypothetical protein [unclassified Paenibacillus]